MRLGFFLFLIKPSDTVLHVLHRWHISNLQLFIFSFPLIKIKRILIIYSPHISKFFSTFSSQLFLLILCYGNGKTTLNFKTGRAFQVWLYILSIFRFRADIPQLHCWKYIPYVCQNGTAAALTICTSARFILRLLTPEVIKLSNTTPHLLPDQMA